MNNFEVVLLINPESANADKEKICSNFEKLLIDESGEIIGKEDWGLRNLAYNIKSSKKAFYNYYQIKINSNKIESLRKNMILNEKIIRFLFIKISEHENLPTKIFKEKE